MFVLESDGKDILAGAGIPVPPGAYLEPGETVAPDRLPVGPWMVKAQVATGGRGKAGGIVAADSVANVEAAIARLSGSSIRNHPVRGFRVEQQLRDAEEVYLSLSVDPTSSMVRLLLSTAGGVDVEMAPKAAVRSELCDPSVEALAQASVRLMEGLPPAFSPVGQALKALSEAFLDLEATLLEVNPLFLPAGGGWVVGDLKLVLDESAFPRNPAGRDLLARRPASYPDARRKAAHGFDYVELDPAGEIGLLTTGAGLSMKMVDDLLARGSRPINFCDLRSGQLRGDPTRIIDALAWIKTSPNLRVLLVNIFAGITDLGEFATLLVTALGRHPELRAPVVARLVGRNLDGARQVLAASELSIQLEPDLDQALALAIQYAQRGA